VRELGPRNAELLRIRARLQEEIDAYHRGRTGREPDPARYERFLREIGYLLPEPGDFAVRTAGVDAEISRIAGPQLVVPVNNARYALNAANARWGSLYDALYGSDAIPEDDGAERGRGFNTRRAARVIAYARKLLDEIAPLADGSHAEVSRYAVAGGALTAELERGRRTGLRQLEKFAGFAGDAASPSAVLLRNHGLHLELRIDRTTQVGRADKAGVADVLVEAAVTTIMDLEDSIAAVDAEEKV